MMISLILYITTPVYDDYTTMRCNIVVADAKDYTDIYAQYMDYRDSCAVI